MSLKHFCLVFLSKFIVLSLISITAKGKEPSLLPLPQSVVWTGNNFSLSTLKTINVADTAFYRPAIDLQNDLIHLGYQPKIHSGGEPGFAIIFRLEKIKTPVATDEAYRLRVSSSQIVLSAASAHGIFNGLQTLRQLMFNGKYVAGCNIIDWPAFSWRGYLVDVGRNFQSVPMLKQQIDVMAKYKLNIFHFHLTEDVAWRLAITQYPQLTAAENMTRNKGDFYSEADMKELIQYCKDRYITLVPEIDMPGHSTAFTRAFGVDMQSEKGLEIVKNILKEIIQTYHLPYLHFGADEVQITNKDFIPEVEKLIHSYGIQTIGWNPGGNYDNATIRELWMAAPMNNPDARYIDARSLYINHMDPLESVVSIFERKLCDTVAGSDKKLGAELCVWNDRRLVHQEDLLTMNPVYPAMLAFAERAWRGGGFPGEVVDIGAVNSVRAKAFDEFENRLLVQKQQYFRQLPFPYVRQGNIHWKMYGPFKNNGNLKQSFWPEKAQRLQDSAPAENVAGGTIYLRHWWFPTLSSWLKNPEANTTWYAYRRIWKDKTGAGFMWIGFNNISTSMATDAPGRGTWDNKNSEIWLNGNLIPPPDWKLSGKTITLETPLVDEGYAYRPATKVYFRKGWNMILIKLPVGSFSGKNWVNPVKWMFTAVPVHQEKNGINMDADKIENKK